MDAIMTPPKPPTSPELKSCPFCGDARDHEVVEQPLTSDPMPIYFVECSRCGAQGPCEDNKEQAVKSWNTRHEGEESE